MNLSPQKTKTTDNPASSASASHSFGAKLRKINPKSKPTSINLKSKSFKLKSFKLKPNKITPILSAALLCGFGLVTSTAMAASASSRHHSTNNQHHPASKGPAYDTPTASALAADPADNYAALVRGNSVVPKNGFVDVGATASDKTPAADASSKGKGAAYDQPIAAGVPFGIGLIANADGYYSTASRYWAGVPFGDASDSEYDDLGRSYADFYLRNANILLTSNFGIVHGTVNLGWNNISARNADKSDDLASRAALVNEAYVSLYRNDFSLPLYLTVGRKYINYGDYDVYSIAPSLTQYLTQVNGAGAELGFVAPLAGSALFGNITGFGGPTTSLFDSYIEDYGIKQRHPINFSVKLGAQTEFSAGSLARAVQTTVDVSYLHRVQDLAYFNSNAVGLNGSAGTGFFAMGDNSLYGNDGIKALGGINDHLSFKVGAGELQGTALDINFASFLGKGYWSYFDGYDVGAKTYKSPATKGSPWALSIAGSYQVNNLPLLQSAAVLFGGGLSHNAGINLDGAVDNADGGAPIGLVLPAWQMHFGLAMGISKSLTATLLYQYNAKPKFTESNGGDWNKSGLAPLKAAYKNSNVIMLRFGFDV